MKKIIILVLIIAASFCAGYYSNFLIAKKTEQTETVRPLVNVPVNKKVTSIGGVFFKCKDPAKLKEWYQTNLGLTCDQYGAVFEWRHATDSTKKGFTQWSPFSEKTKYFEPSACDHMINYRVGDLTALVAELQKSGVTICDTMESVDYGKFIHILDCEGNKIELWEPNDIEYEKLGVQMGAKTTK